jgi:class 3 adenylate cyclase/predicted ATPase
MDLGGWLRGLGLEQYEAAFRENAIDDTVLPDLTEEHLREIGMPLGARIKLLKAIAALREQTETIPTTNAQSARPPVEGAERRQLTVMFCDLVGSTALAASMDPEDLREVISAYQNCAAETVRRFDGFVAKFMGDGVLVYFGYPQAHEDDAERAIRAGLELVSALAGLKSGAPLQTRVGIATGVVVVGDLIGSGEAQERGIVGETPNLAARLQAIAEPNTVVIADNTRRLVGSLFEFKDLGLKDLKGIAGPARAWAALRPSLVESRFEALHASQLTALVGREEENELLLRRWSRAKTGEGQVVLLSGEAGIGKSRLTATLLEHLATEPHTRLRYFCSPQHTDSAFYPIIGQMERAARLAHDDTPTTRLEKLDALLAQTSTSAQDAALLARLLSLPNDGRYPALDLTPQQRRQKTIDALISQIEVLTRSSPVLMIFEDAHWTDPSSLELLGRTLDRIATLPVLLIVTFRPEFEPPWIRRPHVTTSTINRLGNREVGAMINRMIGNKPLPASIKQDIIDRTDGIPLFVEEMTKAVVEAGDEGEAQQTAATIPSTTLAVPATLHASLMARLDRLGGAKEVAQVGSAIGREFSHTLLISVMRHPEAKLGSTLDRLISAGLLFRQGVPPHSTYLFKHALVQDAAYSTLLREPRRALHGRIADVLANQFPEIAENQPELLARHCTEAGMVEKAAGLWGKAGRQSVERSALVEATEQFNRALDQIATLPSTPELRREQINLQVALITPLMHVKGYAAPETKAAEERARLLIEEAQALGEAPDDPLLLFLLLYGFWVVNFMTFNGDAMRELAGQFLALAKKHGAAVPLVAGHRIMALSLASTGDIVQGRVHYDQALELYDPVEHQLLANRFGTDSRVSILSFRSLVLWFLGYPEAALADAAQAIREGRETGQAATLMFALDITGVTQTFCGNHTTATTQFNELAATADKTGSTFWKAAAVAHHGWARAVASKASEVTELITDGITALRSTGTVWIPLLLAQLARGHAEVGQFADASRTIGEAFTAIEASKERWYEAETDRVAGEIELLTPESDARKAEAYFERALAVAREQQAKSLELRAAMSMARLWRDQAKHQLARELLAPVYGWFTEGFDTLDLKEAKALLDALSSGAQE